MIETRDVAGEHVLVLSDVILVASRSRPGAWHEVRDGRCDCPGFVHRGLCRHVRAVEALKADAKPEKE